MALEKNPLNMSSSFVTVDLSEGQPKKPEKLDDLDKAKTLTVYDQQGQTHVGTKVSLEYVRQKLDWVLTIKVSESETKQLLGHEISAITRNL